MNNTNLLHGATRMNGADINGPIYISKTINTYTPPNQPLNINYVGGRVYGGNYPTFINGVLQTNKK